MRLQTVRLRLDNEVLIGRKGIAILGKEDQATGCACPACKQSARKKTPKGDVTQYGFAWDWHRTFFQCKCGCVFFHDYRIWHDDTEREA